MAEADFVPFVARRKCAEPSSQPERNNGPSGPPERSDGPLGPRDGAVELARQNEKSNENSDGAANTSPSEDVKVKPASCDLDRPQDEERNAAVELARPTCNHGQQIRNEAIRLAAIACGRALRRAIVLHPRVIASLVDEAIAAAGNPDHARVRAHPDAIAAIAENRHDCIADAALALGDVVIESDGTTVGANVDSFAGLLARAAAEA